MTSSHNKSVQSAKLIELPEIMVNIAYYLDMNSLLACVQVSKNWNRIFIPALWTDIDIGESPKAPEPFAVEKHAQLIKSMSITEFIPTSLQSIELTNLKDLYIYGTFSRDNFKFSPQTLYNFPAIETLSIGYNVEVPDRVGLWKALANLPKLKSLNISETVFIPEPIDDFWSVFSRLERISLTEIEFPETFFTQPLGILPLSMKDFSVWTSNSKILEIVKKCNKLERLYWSIGWRQSREVKGFINNFKDTIWPNLSELHLGSFLLGNADLQLILNSVKVLNGLSVDDSASWGPESFNALSSHFGTIRTLFLNKFSPTFTSLMINTVLCSCPKLEYFSAQTIRGLDIINNKQLSRNEQNTQGWVCTQLRCLSLRFDLEGVDSQIPILEQLSRLTELTELNLRLEGEGLDFPSLNFNLEKGLDILKPLKHLCKLVLSGTAQEMSERDILWIVENFGDLDIFKGKFSNDFQTHRVLYELYDAERQKRITLTR